jgi:hypothetical protein
MMIMKQLYTHSVEFGLLVHSGRERLAYRL